MKGCFLYKDMFNYFNRIKKIDKDYVLLFDNINKLFIIINSAKNNEICLKFNDFKLNIEEVLQRTRIENSTKIFNEIDNINSKVLNDNFKKSRQDLENKVVDLNEYSKRTNKILQSDINKILGVKDV